MDTTLQAAGNAIAHVPIRWHRSLPRQPFIHVLLALMLLLPALSALGQALQTPRDEVWLTDGNVLASVANDETVYIGGNFTYVGPSTDRFVPIDKVSGDPVESFPRVNGTVRAVASDGSGGWYIGGAFSRVGGFPRTKIARIRADGSVDPDFLAPNAIDPNPDIDIIDGTVWAIAVSPDGSTVYAGGQFTSIGGQPRNGIAALDATSGDATAWNPDAGGLANMFTSIPVMALAVSPDGSTIYAGGQFTTIGGESRNRIAALDASTGVATVWNAGLTGSFSSSYVSALALSVDGSTVYAGGFFNGIDGLTRNSIAAMEASTGAATDWNPNSNSTVESLVVSGDGTTIYVGGNFSSIGGQSRSRIAALHASTGAASSWNPGANVGSSVNTLALSGSTVYVGGSFTSIGGQPRNRIAALDATSGLVTPWNPNAMERVMALGVSDQTVLVGGFFRSIGGQTRNRIAALDASTGAATAWNPDIRGLGGTSNEVRALAISGDGNTIYAGGFFTTSGGQSRGNLAAVDVATGATTAWNPTASGGSVFALEVADSTVYVGGTFTSVSGQPRNGIAALDATSGLATSWDPNANFGSVAALAVSGSTVFAGGNFNTIGGAARSNIAALDETTGAATPWNPNAVGGVITLAVSGDGSTIYAGGVFTSIGGQARNRIAALDATTGAATDWDPDANAAVFALAAKDSTIFAGGIFGFIGGQSRLRIAALSATSGEATDWNPGASGAVRAFALSSSSILVGGEFAVIGGQQRQGLSAFSLDVPLLIELDQFSAHSLGVGHPVEIQWSTATEIDNVGFHLERVRFDSGSIVPAGRVNDTIIPGAGTTFNGADYSFTDQLVFSEGEQRGYVLVDIDANGKQSSHGPIRVEVREPDAAGEQEWMLY